MAERIERQVQGQRELLAGVSHEIRTPLARLRVLTEMLRDKQAEPKLLEEAEREIAEIDDLTGSLLATSRLDFGGVERRALDAEDLAREALRRVELSPDLLQVETADVSLRGDATLLGRALVNLLNNAKRHGAGVRRVRICEAEDGLPGEEGSLWFVVEDAGPGFVEAERQRVFDAFFQSGGARAGNEAATESSLGLGLHLVQRIAHVHGGQVVAQNLSAGGALVGFSVGP
jgi:two-component system, OmpR family, sensor kinase